MPIEDIEFYAERRDLSLDVLSLNLIRQLSHLAWRVLQVDGRESICRRKRLLSQGANRPPPRRHGDRRGRLEGRVLSGRGKRPRRLPTQGKVPPVGFRSRRSYGPGQLAIPSRVPA